MSSSFLEIWNSYKDADVVLVPAPYENKVSWRKGTVNGPKAIIEASSELEYFSTYFKEEICEKVKIHTSEDLDIREKDYEEMIEVVGEKLSNILKDGKKFGLIGGEHSISIGAFDAISKEKDFSILHLDAHADLRDNYLGSKYNHGCVMRRALEKTKEIVSVGVRSLSKEEYELIKKEKLNVFGTDFENKEILDKLQKKVYLTIDLDVFDPGELHAVGTPQPGGLRWKEVLGLLEAVGKDKEIIGFDVVELSPFRECKRSDFLAAKLVYNLIGYCFMDKFK